MGQKTTETYIIELEQSVTNLTQLLEVNMVLNTALLSGGSRINSLLTYLMNAAAEITDAESASVLLWQDNIQELVFAATTSKHRESQGLIGKPVPIDSIAGTILKERRLIQVDDTKSDPRHYGGTDKDIQFVTHSLLGVPMISKDKVIGVLEVVNKRILPWTMEDRNNLSVLATEAAIAIEVANLVTDLQIANDELSQVDKLKSDFIAIASHELRTPLGIILGYASFLEESDDEDTKDLASKVMSSGLQLRRIIENMVNLRYLKQNPSDLQRSPTSLRALVNSVEENVRTLIGASSHELVVDCQDADAQINIDASRMQMALNNLMNNAIEFTPGGGTITLRTSKTNLHEAWISVTDTGVGLEEDQLERIFDEFIQVEDHMTRHHGGLGIGLSISRALVQAHGGRIWAESAGLGQGSTFNVSIPLA